MSALEQYLKKTEADHDHICSGQVLGIRMAARLDLKILCLKPYLEAASG
jgi:formylmethanofuran dehydrogenase subunit E